MHRTFTALALACLAAGAACSRSNNTPADTSLNTDLSLAAQAHGLDSIADTVATGANALNARSVPSSSASAPVHHTTTHHAASSSGTRVYESGGTVTSSHQTVVKNTKRDAAIGAAAGAILGATTSRNKVKGGVIGAAVGGILGGVIGNNVDVHKKP